jgi:acyl carrier protein
LSSTTSAGAELELEVKRLLVDALKLEDTEPEDIDSDAALVGEGLGLDSIDILELAIAVQREFGVKTDADDARSQTIYASVKNLAAFIAEQRGKQ